MKTKNLLPHRWKPAGWVLLAANLLWAIWAVSSDNAILSGVEVTLPWPFSSIDTSQNGLLNTVRYNGDGTITLELMDELIALGILAGLLIVGFARAKDEDERTAQMRLGALQWAIYGNTLVLALCLMFVYGFRFMNVMIYNMFTPLLIFVLRFHWLLYREVREAKTHETGLLAL